MIGKGNFTRKLLTLLIACLRSFYEKFRFPFSGIVNDVT